MSLRLVFATGNPNKLSEIQAMVPDHIELLGLADINGQDELPETHETLEENASEKAWYIYNKHQIDCFSEDTGLEIAALNGAPGVLSARYAGTNKSAKDNMDRVLEEMHGISDRKAHFRAIISLIINKVETQFEGVVEGIIAEKSQGEGGFGYDPIFIPDGYDQTFAEMGVEKKNTMSHRKHAFSKLIAWLEGNVAK